MSKNAIILAAGYASRFVPISLEKPKSLIPVKGEILIERQIRQLLKAGVQEIIVVTGYMKEQFLWLQEKYGVILVNNPDYETTNNISSLYYAAEYIGDTFLCLSDHYYTKNPYLGEFPSSGYLCSYSEGPTSEWCVTSDETERITGVSIGGANAWYMAGFAWFSREFSAAFTEKLKNAYTEKKNRNMFWEDLFLAELPSLPPMYIRKAEPGLIHEFDSLDELRIFDWDYLISSHSRIMEELCGIYQCTEGELYDFRPLKDENGKVAGFSYMYQENTYTQLTV